MVFFGYFLSSFCVIFFSHAVKVCQPWTVFLSIDLIALYTASKIGLWCSSIVQSEASQNVKEIRELRLKN